MDWEKKFNSIIRDTDANLEKVKSRVMLSQRAASMAVTPTASVSSPGAVMPAAPALSGMADLNATVQRHTAELRRLAGVQRRHELESEYVRAELVRIRRDVKKLSTADPSRPAADPTPTPPPTPGPTPAQRSSQLPTMNSEDVLRRLALLEEHVAALQEQRNREKMPPPRPFGIGSSLLACVDNHFPAEVDDVTPTGNGQLTEPLGFNLDDLALSDSDDH